MPLEQAVQQGIVKGYPDGDFRPDATDISSYRRFSGFCAKMN